MDRDTPRPLTTEEAKARLREVAERASPSYWLRQHPLRVLTVALVGGFIAARLSLPSIRGFLLAEKLVAPLIFGPGRHKKTRDCVSKN